MKLIEVLVQDTEGASLLCHHERAFDDALEAVMHRKVGTSTVSLKVDHPVVALAEAIQQAAEGRMAPITRERGSDQEDARRSCEREITPGFVRGLP